MQPPLELSSTFAALAVLLATTPASASVVTLANDSTNNGTGSSPGNFFISGEETAAWLTSSCDGVLVGAQVYWLSQFGGTPASLETDVTIYASGSFPTPGTILTNQGGAPAVISAPTLADGVMNDFRYLDPPTNTTPLRIPVTTGQTVVVSLEHLNQNAGIPLAPGVGYDADGCQPNLNTVNAIPGGWTNACAVGVTGDWVIRAVVDCEGLGLPSASRPGWIALGAALLGIGAWAARRLGPSG